MSSPQNTRWLRHAALALAGMLLVVGTVAIAGFPNKRLSDEKRGAELYDRHCTQCHGAHGAGDGPASASLVKPVPDLREALAPEKGDDQVAIILEGRDAMPSYANAFDRYDARRVLRHMRRVATSEDEADDGSPEGEADSPDGAGPQGAEEGPEAGAPEGVEEGP